MNSRVPYALITGGGTVVQVDTMRTMGNSAEGDFSLAFARQFSSSQATLELSIPRLPKVLDTWREKFGIKCLIVGFKLLSRANSTISDVIAAARSW